MGDHRDDWDLTGSEAIAAVLKAAGVQYAFAYPGTSELALCDAIERAGSLTLVNGWGDKESAFMAAGASVLEANCGVAILHGARGLTNAAGALADVRRSELGTVFVVGLPSTNTSRFLPPHGEPGLISTMGHLAGWAWEAPAVPEGIAARATAAAEMIGKLREGLATAARAPRGPALFGVPQDVAEQRWVPRSALLDSSQPGPSPSPSDVRPAVDLLRTARRPLFLVDDYALRYEGLRGALDDISRLTGGPVLQVRYRRGPMLFERLHAIDVPNFVGWLDPFSSAHKALLRECDLLVTIEDRNIYPRVVGPLPPCRKLAVTSDPRKVHKNGYLGPGDVLIDGDPATILRSLTVALGGNRRPVQGWFDVEPRIEPTLGMDLPSDTVLYGRGMLCRVFGRLLARWERAVLFDDSQMFGGLLSEHYDEFPVGLRVFASHGGFVGGGIAQATGLAIADRDVRIMCTLGDHGFTNGFQGLTAAVQQRARVLYVVCNNGGSVSLQKEAAAIDPPARGYLANVEGFCYHAVAASIGVPAERVEVPIGSAPPEIDAAMLRVAKVLDDATAVDGPSLVELVLPADPDVWRGIWLLKGFEERQGRGQHVNTR